MVYNADSGTLAAVIDSARKLLSIDGCPLCSLTHSLRGESAEWRSYREQLGVEVDYVHRDELSGELKALTASKLPCIVARVGTDLVVLLERKGIEECGGSVETLHDRIRAEALRQQLDV